MPLNKFWIMKIRIFDTDNWSEIAATLARNKTRTFMTGFGIFWGTAMLALLMGGANGFENVMRRNFAGFATNVALISSAPTTESYNGFNKGMMWDLTLNDVVDLRRRIEGIDAISGVVSRQFTAEYGRNSTSAPLQGVESDFTKILEPVIYEGRFINASDDASVRKNCVIGKKVADELFGSESPIGKFVNVGGIYFHIVGVAGQVAEASVTGPPIDETIIIPLSVMQRAYNIGTDMDFCFFTAKDYTRPKEIKNHVFNVLRSNHSMLSPTDDHAIMFFDISEQFDMVAGLFLGIRLLALFVGAGTLLAGVIGVGNIMWVIVKERTHEIGIRRALGATPGDVIAQILSESVVLTTVAGIGGIILACGILAVLDNANNGPGLPPAHFQLSFGGALTILIVFLILGSAAGLVPSLKAMRIKPIEALNDK